MIKLSSTYAKSKNAFTLNPTTSSTQHVHLKHYNANHSISPKLYYSSNQVRLDRNDHQQVYTTTHYDTKIINYHSKLTKHVFETTGKYNLTTQL